MAHKENDQCYNDCCNRCNYSNDERNGHLIVGNIRLTIYIQFDHIHVPCRNRHQNANAFDGNEYKPNDNIRTVFEQQQYDNRSNCEVKRTRVKKFECRFDSIWLTECCAKHVEDLIWTCRYIFVYFVEKFTNSIFRKNIIRLLTRIAG